MNHTEAIGKLVTGQRRGQKAGSSSMGFLCLCLGKEKESDRLEIRHGQQDTWTRMGKK